MRVKQKNVTNWLNLTCSFTSCCTLFFFTLLHPGSSIKVNLRELSVSLCDEEGNKHIVLYISLLYIPLWICMNLLSIYLVWPKPKLWSKCQVLNCLSFFSFLNSFYFFLAVVRVDLRVSGSQYQLRLTPPIYSAFFITWPLEISKFRWCGHH